MNILKFFKKKKEENLLVIKQKDINSVPTVIYKGKEILLKQQINFNWDTKDVDKPYGTAFSVQYTESTKGEYPIITECYTHPSKLNLLDVTLYTKYKN